MDSVSVSAFLLQLLTARALFHLTCPFTLLLRCLDFNPVDDKYFISGSLDNKIRIWNIPEHRVIDWTDMREMVTACTYTGDGSVSHPSVSDRLAFFLDLLPVLVWCTTGGRAAIFRHY